TTFEMMNLMTDMVKTWNQTMVIVTHDNEISGYASRIINIRDGKIEKIENGRDLHDEEINA
ncbi:MAG: ABC transporter ATP-binding protein, partial [Clostridiaceae bacterium]|nr:ABC transporter ATP-binding protein [Clostridiaceae bacterium]